MGDLRETPAGWDGILAPDEKIIWQGVPTARMTLRGQRIPTMAFGLFFSGFALVWMVLASQAGGSFWMFGLLHFAVGLGVAFGPLIMTYIMSGRTWYTLTNQRAYIATRSLLGAKELQSYPITPDTQLGMTGDTFKTVTFGEMTKRGSKGRSYQLKIGFRDLEDGDEVYQLMRDVQRKQT
ncbi:aspartate carbamoyltransferase catalytic subunit [Yoonia sp. 208BN28-4]|uniref:aspartate carbamoyltransferase catalytic subunit n=1 Tax=Yoonia sp. 208BN28-4 TaxID=3126505 RepID=UPI0030A2BE3A